MSESLSSTQTVEPGLDPHVNGSTAIASASVVEPGTTSRASKRSSPPRPRRRWIGRLVFWGLLAGTAIAVAAYKPARDLAEKAAAYVAGGEPDESQGESVGDPPKLSETWDGLVEIKPSQVSAVGLQITDVLPQTDPVKLEINGVTAYDPNNQVQIRPKFNSLIDKVYVNLGQQVEAGEPLVDLFSAELAAAKSDYEKQMAQWEHDKKELERAEKLYRSPERAISEKEYLTVANDEKLSGTEAKLAADKLLVYGLTARDIENVPHEDGTQKAKMTLRAPASGYVIRRDAVQGNRYAETDILLIIAPIDHFWVWGNVYPSDAARVTRGLPWVVRCPLIDHDIPTEIDSITSEIARDTKTVRIRSRIENVGGELKADMLVSGYVLVPPLKGRTVIPRIAMISADGADYVFVERPRACGPRGLVASASTIGTSFFLRDCDPDCPLRFERRMVRVEQETSNHVIIGEGLDPGERIATQGSLILDQIYADASTTETRATQIAQSR
jgi:cobalt-zinc-cadmium efflux system membrane fusion protein